jgi:hypothetical protein
LPGLLKRNWGQPTRHARIGAPLPPLGGAGRGRQVEWPEVKSEAAVVAGTFVGGDEQYDMSEAEPQPGAPKPRLRWFHLTPGHFVSLLLLVECSLWLSQRFRWLRLNEQKGWTVLFSVGLVGAVGLVMLMWWAVALICRWRFQFSLRTMMAMVLAVALACSWLGVEMKAAKRQREAVAALKGAVTYDDNYIPCTDSYYQGVKAEQWPIQPWLVHALGYDFFRNVVHTAVTDDDALDQVRNFPEIAGLNINNASDASLGRLAAQKGRHLRVLHLSGQELTDTGLKDLDRFDDLQELQVPGTLITDAGIARLKGLTRLRRLTVFNSNMTDAEENSLKAALPNCVIERTDSWNWRFTR